MSKKDTDPCNDGAQTIADVAAAAKAAAAVAETAIAAAKEAAAKLAELEVAAAAAAEQAEATATRKLAEAQAAASAASERTAAAKTACDSFLKDSSASADKIAKAKELGQAYVDRLKEQREAQNALAEAEKAERPFQVPRLRAQVADLEEEITQLTAQIDNKTKETDELRSSSRASCRMKYSEASQCRQVLHQEVIGKNAELQRLKQQLVAAEIAAGIRFANNHAPYHEMILRAALNGGAYMVMCSCGHSMRWTTEAEYPPKCSDTNKGCGKAGW